MTDKLQELELAPEPKTESSIIEPNIISPAAKKSNKNLWIISSTVIVTICICSILCLVLVAAGSVQVMTEKAPVESVIDTFMKDMDAKDVESAYALFSPRSQRKTPISDFEKMIQGNTYVLFEAYESLSVQNFNLTAAANTNPDSPQGNVANVTGIISYKNDFTGQFKAILEKVNGTWKIYYINVTVPPNKFQP